MNHLKLSMQNKEYRSTKHGNKVYLDGKCVCMECDEPIMAKSYSPWCKFCEKMMNVRILEEYNNGVPANIIKLRYKVGFSYLRYILGYDLRVSYSRSNKHTYKKVKVEKEGKDYAEILADKLQPVKDSLSFLKSKIKI